jgi:dTMP kinase
MKGKLIVIEGMDGSGKSTQLGLLKRRLEATGCGNTHYVHFPQLNQGWYGDMIAEFLRGEYGAMDEVHPKLAALLFAGDRKEHIEEVQQALREGCTVLADRYVNSNIAFQCAKMKDPFKSKELKDWILRFEYGYHGLPVPHRAFYLDVPFSHIEQSLTQAREGADRSYLNGKVDIHESSLSFQRRVGEEYKKLACEQREFIPIVCADDQGRMLRPEVIGEGIMGWMDWL